MNPHLKGSLLIILSTLLFATQGTFIRFISMDTLPLMAYFELFFLVLLIVFIMITGKTDSFVLQHPKIPLFLSIIFITINLFAYYSALRLTTFANAMFTHYTAPIFALIIAVLFLKEKFEWQSLVAVILSMVGMFFLLNNPELSGHIIGISLGLASGVAYGIIINLNKLLVKKDILSLMLYQTFPVVIILSPFLFTQVPSLKDFILIAIMTVIAGIIAASIYLYGLKSVKAQHAGIIAYTEILFMLIFGFIFFKEIPTIMTWLGGSLIIISGIWIVIDESKRKDHIRSVH